MTEAPTRPLTRRALLGTSAALGAALPLTGLGVGTANAEPTEHGMQGPHAGSLKAAVGFLQLATDAYRTSGFRLVQSFQDASGLGDIGFTYDNGLTAMALLCTGDVTRASAVGDGLLYAQTHDADFDDFRLRQAYHTNNFVDSNGNAVPGFDFGLIGTAVGDMSWAGLALAHLAHHTKSPRFLTGAVRIGTWIVDNAYSTTGLGGYTFGETAGLQDHKSTEHNIDVYGFFRLLARLTGDRIWRDRADHALKFIEAVWNADAGFFWTGSDNGADINKNPLQLPLDVQTWSWLSVMKRKYAAALDWALNNLATTDTPLRANSTLTGNQSVHGVVFASGTLLADTSTNIGGQSFNPKPDDGAVWFEGTGQMALALKKRGAHGDGRRAADLLGQIRYAQHNLGHGQTFGGKPAPGGIVAASSPLDTGFGFGYFPNLHTAATSWYVFAATGFNPYRF